MSKIVIDVVSRACERNNSTELHLHSDNGQATPPPPPTLPPRCIHTYMGVRVESYVYPRVAS